MQSDPATHHVLLDAHESRGLASTVLIARQLLDHDDLDPDQRQRIMGSLARAATTLAHHVLAAEPVSGSAMESSDAA